MFRSASRPTALVVSVLLLCVAGPVAFAAVADPAELPLHHWGLGWDPVETGRGLTLRYRFSPVWDLSIAGGPNDYRSDVETTRWDDDGDVADDGALSTDDHRREQGWVRLTGGRRVWHDDRFAAAAMLGVAYRWSNEEYNRRYLADYNDVIQDYYNESERHDIGNWDVALGLRPSWDVTPRLRIEFECGVIFGRSKDEVLVEEWWDSLLPTVREEETRHDKDFTTYGGFDWTSLKFIFWF